MSGRAKRLFLFMLVLSVACVLGGVVWASVEGARGARYGKATATVTACEKDELGGESVTVRVLAEYEANGVKYENVSYIGDLNRCKEGMQMRVYYIKSAPAEYVYSKSSDLGFALILLCGGVLWLCLTVVYAVAMKKTGYWQ